MRLVEKTEAHVVIGLLLLLLLGGSGGLLSGGTTGSSTAGSSGTTSATRGDGGELLRAGSDELRGVRQGSYGGAARERTSLMSLPSSSERSFSRRSLSASMPTDSRTAFTSAAEGEVFPPRPRRR